MVKPLQYMLIYLYISIMLLRSNNTVFLNTTSGSRKPPEYFIFASHDKFKIFFRVQNIGVLFSFISPADRSVATGTSHRQGRTGQD